MRRMMHAAAFLLATASLGQAQTVSVKSQPAADHDSGRPYSQLASYMTCSDWSPNLWNNYACERAATAACISKHVDMRCNCFECKQRLHSHHSGLGGGDCSGESCNAGCGRKLTNRYRQPMSTLYSASSNFCNPPCTGVSGCESTIPSIQGANTTQPASSELPSIASPPHNRVATPMIDNPMSSISILNNQPSFEARR